MSKIESDKVNVNKSAGDVFNFLMNFNNFEKIMPQDKVSGWSSAEKEFSFKFIGLARIGMALKDTIPEKVINITSHGKNPFDFTLKVSIDAQPDNTSEVKMIFEAEINPFLQMMVNKPLESLFTGLTENLKKMYEKP